MHITRCGVCVVQLGEEVQVEFPSKRREVQKTCRQVQQRWSELQTKMADRGDKLRQAGQQEQLMELLQVSTRQYILSVLAALCLYST